MKEQLLALYEVQKLDARLADIRAGLGRLNAAAALRAQLAQAEQNFHDAERRLHELETELKDSELKLKSIDEKRSSCEKRLYGGTVHNPRELSAMEKEVEMLKSQQGQLDGRVLELYDRVEAARARYAEAEKVVNDLREQIQRRLQQEADERRRLETELADVESERNRAAERVTDASLMARYQSIASRAGGIGIAKVTDGKCEACRVSVTPFILRKLFEAQDLERCENCGRILLLDVK